MKSGTIEDAIMIDVQWILHVFRVGDVKEVDVTTGS